MNCFGFGTTFSPAVVLDITSLIQQHSVSDSANAAAHQASDGMAHGQNPDRTLDCAEVAAYQGSDSTVCRQNPNSISAIDDAAAAFQSSDNTAHGQNPDRTLAGEAWPEAKRLEPIAKYHAVIGTKPTPSPTGGIRGEYLQGGAGRGGPNAAPSLNSGSHPQDEQLSQQAACNGQGHGQAQDASKQGLAVVRLQAKAAKDALKGLRWLDRSCRADVNTSSGVVSLPLTDSGCAMLQSAEFSFAQPESDSAGSIEPSSSQYSSALFTSAGPSSAELSSSQLSCDGLSPAQHSSVGQLNDADAGSVPRSSSYTDPCMASSQPLPTGAVPLTDGSSGMMEGSTVGAKGRERKAVGSQKADMACLQALMQAGLAVVRPMATSQSSRLEGTPAQRLKRAVTALLQQQVSPTLMCCATMLCTIFLILLWLNGILDLLHVHLQGAAGIFCSNSTWTIVLLHD